MNKQELIERISVDAGVTKVEAESMMKSLKDVIHETVCSGGVVTIQDIGSFQSVERKARDGRNPQTGETIKIQASTAAKFKVAKKFKDVLNTDA